MNLESGQHDPGSASASPCTRELFLRHGLRCTRQRMAIYDALRGSDSHPTAESIFQTVKTRTGRLSLATVYNTLEALCDAGLARKLPTTHGCCRYDGDTREHLHVRCSETGEIHDVPEDLGIRFLESVPREIIERIEAHLGVRIEGVSVQLIGRRRPR